MRDTMLLDDPSNCPSTSNPSSCVAEAVSSNSSYKRSTDNVYNLLARREVTSRTKRLTRRLWGEGLEGCSDSRGQILEVGRDARRGLISWVEAESLCHFSAQYCPLLPPPRSTIAAAFSSDGKTLASTHGDHTVKIIDCQTGNCLKVLSGHRRTPWVVRFHPTCPFLLASGSLDHEVRLWDANTAECIGSRDFYRPIASIAFHAQGELLAVASGHKLYIWHYNRRGEASTPTIVLTTRRSLRAVHFHPRAAPFLLTAEVNDLDSADSSMTLATSRGYMRYPPPTVYFADTYSWDRPSLLEELPRTSMPYLIWPPPSINNARISSQHPDGAGLASTQQRVGPASVRLLTYSTPSGQYELLLSPIESNNTSRTLDERPNRGSAELDTMTSDMATDAMDSSDVQPEERNTQFLPFGDPAYWELPFVQGWLIGQSQGDQHMMRSLNGNLQELPSTLPPVQGGSSNQSSNHEPVSPGSNTRGIRRLRHRISHSRTTGSAAVTEGTNRLADEGDTQPVISRIQTELSASLAAAAAAAELPCTVKLRIWPHDIRDPCAPLEVHRCRLTIPHAVLCSEMGAHFSPCGRFLAACVACMLPPPEGEYGLHMQTQHDVSRSSSSPTRHPISAQPIIYELRIYSLEEATFGLVLASRAVRAAHCLTSIQFSPTSEHLLLAYGRRHNSLLKSVVIDGRNTVHIYTILEVYRVSDMELVRVLPSAEDEVNVACFHPDAGGGLVYGTKEGKLRILQYDCSNGTSTTSSSLEENFVEVPSHALEG
ncbi:uncharacterized protein LOC141642252 [Silene latifolia]|uniref:uncharacterized protein LOC141642252 n=1 Tax=Silene latifolia TaxID=37657 RepID=UPI003D782189